MGACNSKKARAAAASRPTLEVQYEDDDDDLYGTSEKSETLLRSEALKSSNRRRTGVSAAPLDPANMKAKVVIKKDDSDRDIIRKRLKTSFLFNAIDKEHLENLIDAVDIKYFKAGDALMEQGGEGDYFYIVEEGTAQCFIKLPEGEKMVKEYDSGGQFGELALMYNAPRAATIRATSDMKCWAIDTETFKYTLMASAINKRGRYESFLKKVPIMQELSDIEMSSIADSLNDAEFKAGEEIIIQGQDGNMFYIIEKGRVKFIKDEAEVGEAGVGGYFGEIALLTNEKRQVTVVASEESLMLTLDRKTFVRVMGPMDTILQRNMDTYKNYKSK